MNRFDDYSSRKKELKYFWIILSSLDEASLFNINIPETKKNEINTLLPSIKEVIKYEHFDFFDFLRMLKSSYILMLYNLIESSITIFITAIYDTIRDENISYHEATEQLQNLWVQNLLVDSFDQEANFKTFKNKAVEVINKVLDNNMLYFEIHKLPNIHGNINFSVINKICRTHGIRLQSNSRAQDDNGNYSMNTIKNERNALAHGRKSFIECSRNYSINDLNKFTDEIELLLDDLAQTIANFIDTKSYLNTTN